MTRRKKILDIEKIFPDEKKIVREIVNSLVFPFYIIDVKNYKILYANKTLLEKTKKSKNMKCYRVTHKRNSPCTEEHVCPLKEVLKTKKPVKVEHIHYDKDGNEKNVEVHGYPIFDDKGKVVKMIEYSLDLSRIKEIESEVSKLKKAIETADEVIFMTDTEGIFTYANPSFTKVYGFKNSEIIGKKTPRIIKSGIMGNEVYENFWNTLLYKQIIKGELINKTKDGKLINIEGSANPILDEKGNIIGFLAIQRDITEEKKVQEKLKDQMDTLERFKNATVSSILEIKQVEEENNRLKKQIEEDKKVISELKKQ